MSSANAGNAVVSGTIAIRGVDGKYLKVTPNDRLEFGNQKLDDNAKFEVIKHDNGKVGLRGSNGNILRMYYVDDVTSEAGSVQFGIVYLGQQMVNFTVSGYQGQDGRTRFLSSQAGGEAYNGSIAVKEFEDFTCRFTIQNL